MIYFNKNKDTIEYIIHEKELSSCFSKKDKININDYTNESEADVEDNTQESETEADVEDNTQESESEVDIQDDTQESEYETDVEEDTQESEDEPENDFEYLDDKRISIEPNNWNAELRNTLFYFGIFFILFRFIHKLIYVEETKCVI